MNVVRTVALLMVLAAPAAAADRAPLYLPTRDVAVSYRVAGRVAQQVRELHVRFSGARRLLRVETEDRGMGFLLVDPIARTAKMIVPSVRQSIDLPLARDRRVALLFGDGLQFTRRGKAKIAGRDCTNWDVRSERDSATVCLTADGVLLRAQGRGGDIADTSLTATRVDDAPLSPGLFQMPAGTGGLNLPGAILPFLQPGR